MIYILASRSKFRVLSNIIKPLATIHFLIYLLNCDRQLLTCNGGNVYLIKIYIWYIGSKIYGPMVRKLFSGSDIKVFCYYLKNHKPQEETLNCKNVRLKMMYNLTSKSKFKVLSNIIKPLTTKRFFLIYLSNCDRQLITCNRGNVYLIKIYIWYIGSKIIGPRDRKSTRLNSSHP